VCPAAGVPDNKRFPHPTLEARLAANEVKKELCPSSEFLKAKRNEEQTNTIATGGEKK